MKTFMRRSPHVKASIKTISLPELTAYLHHKQWREVPSRNPNAAIYHGPLDIYGKPLVAVLPAREDLEDSERRINDVVRMLTTLEAKSHDQLVREIRDVKAQRKAKRALASSNNSSPVSA